MNAASPGTVCDRWTRNGATVTIAHARRQDLRQCEALARDVFGHSDLEAIPAQQMYTTTLHGGVTLVAFEDHELCAELYACPGRDGRGELLYLASLAVRPESRRYGIGYALMRTMRDWAGREGYERIKWTTNALSASNLSLYLSRCRAQLIGYRASMYAGLIGASTAGEQAGDEAEIEWKLGLRSADPEFADEPTTVAHAMMRHPAMQDGAGIQQFVFPRPCHVELPRRVNDDAGSGGDSSAESRRWRGALRSLVPRLLHLGYVGTAIEQESDGRPFLRFEVLRRAGFHGDRVSWPPASPW